MQNPILNEVKTLNEFITSHIIPKANKFHGNIITYANSYKIHYEDWKKKTLGINDEKEIFLITADLHKEMEKELHSYQSLMDKNVLLSLYEELHSKLTENVELLSSNLVLNQEAAHFNFADGDSQKIRLYKFFKRIFFAISRTVYYTFKSKENEYRWQRSVPLKNLAQHYLIHNYSKELLVSIEKYVESIGANFIDLLNEQNRLDRIFTHNHIPFLPDDEVINLEDTLKSFEDKIDQVITGLEASFQEFSNSISQELNKENESFNRDYDLIGTIALPGSKYKQRVIHKETADREREFQKTAVNYNNFVSAVLERKEYYEDLLIFSSLLISSSYRIDQYSESFLQETVLPVIESIKKEIKNSISRFEETNALDAGVFDKQKDYLRNSIDIKLVPSLITLIISNNFPQTYKAYFQDLEQNLNYFDKEYSFVSPKNLHYRLTREQLKEFSPKEIISPIVLNKISSASEKSLEDFEQKISKLNSTIVGLGRILEFNLESAKIKFTQDNSAHTESSNIAVDGLARAINKSESFLKELEIITSEVTANNRKVIENLLYDLMALTNIDKLITIKLQVSKEKAIQETKERFYNAYKISLESLKWVKKISTNLFLTSREKISGISSKVGLSRAHADLSETMADYLVRVSESLENLPYVYQRLFSNDQIEDERIFIGREEEKEKLKKAISFWVNNQIASVMIIGEKGSGTSSLINITLKQYDFSFKIYRKELNTTRYKETELLAILKDLLKLDAPENFDDLIKEINEPDERRIVILENIEDLFLRIVDGFEAINKLFEIITLTNKKILWITTCNIYSWEYLNRVVNISDYFIFNIKLTGLNEKLIEEIILSRHNISGYDLKFIPSAGTEKQKSFKKLSPKDQQNNLKERYFEQLSKSTSNNIAVALFIWLRSIKKADNEMISVSSDLDIDFSFLNRLSNQKLFSLMAIMLHDGLSCEEHSLIFDMDEKASYLLLTALFDDGIIFKRGIIYKVNFQLYKPIINLLKDKNILH